MIRAKVKRIDFQFITPGQTSRGILYSKPSWFLILRENDRIGVGECSVIPNLNPEYNESYVDKLQEVIESINSGRIPALDELSEYPSICFGLETALLGLNRQPWGILFPSAFTQGEEGIPINGLIWMGSEADMRSRIREKLNAGFRVLKLKVGALDIEEELGLLKSIRRELKPDDLELRLDANGAFTITNALDNLKRLSDFHIHSIEQPILAGQWDEMAKLCITSPIPIALDEELIGVHSAMQKTELLKTIKPHYIIIKPGLVGGLEQSNEWIELAKLMGVGWWATSALESNVGLNAIAQWVFTHNLKAVHGLGTGQIFSNNILSPLELIGSQLFYNPDKRWDRLDEWKEGVME